MIYLFSDQNTYLGERMVNYEGKNSKVVDKLQKLNSKMTLEKQENEVGIHTYIHTHIYIHTYTYIYV